MVELCGQVVSTANTAEQCIIVEVELKDPCNPPDLVQAAPLMDQIYIITDPNHPDYELPEFTVQPDYCEVVYGCDLGSIINDQGAPDTAITQRDSKTFEFFYDKDLAPVRLAQT